MSSRRAVHVEPTPQAVAERAAEWVSATLDRALAERGRAGLALSGGTTPRLLYERLAEPPYARWSGWGRCDVFWVDERAVPPEDEASNYRLAEVALFSRLAEPPRLHRMRGEAADLEAEAARYARELAAWSEGGPPRLDLVLLGLGADGHTASLFPHAPALTASDAWVLAITAPATPRRLTLTLPVLDAARAAAFLVTGAEKAEAVRRVFAPRGSAAEVPARAVRPRGPTEWFLDAAAAGGTRAPSSSLRHPAPNAPPPGVRRARRG